MFGVSGEGVTGVVGRATPPGGGGGSGKSGVGSACSRRGRSVRRVMKGGMEMAEEEEVVATLLVTMDGEDDDGMTGRSSPAKAGWYSDLKLKK